jgi:hypothetical protein
MVTLIAARAAFAESALIGSVLSILERDFFAVLASFTGASVVVWIVIASPPTLSGEDATHDDDTSALHPAHPVRFSIQVCFGRSPGSPLDRDSSGLPEAFAPVT